MGSDDAPVMPRGITMDVVLQHLVAMRLTDAEGEFRGILENVAEEPDAPKTRDLVVATTVLMMSMGGIGWPICMRVLNALRRLSDTQLSEGGVAVLNGDLLLIPRPGVEEEMQIMDMKTLRVLDIDPPRAFVTSIFSMSAIWQQVAELA